MRESRVTWEKREKGAIPVHLGSREKKVPKELKAVKDPEERLALMVHLDRRESRVCQDLRVTLEVRVKKVTKGNKEVMVQLEPKEKGEEMEYQEKEGQLVPEGSEEKGVGEEAKDSLVQKVTLDNQGHQVQLVCLEMMVQVDRGASQESLEHLAFPEKMESLDHLEREGLLARMVPLDPLGNLE